MAFIGNSVQNQGFAPAVDYFNGDGTTVTFTLSRPVASVAQLTAVIENVIQNPTSAFTVSGNQITFTSAPPAGTNNIWIEYTSLITQYNGISQDPSVVGDITASGGYLSTGDFGNSYLDGTIVDYVTGISRITTGPSDGITLYNGGTSARTALMTIDSSGNVGIGTTSPSSKLQLVGDMRINSVATATTGIPIYAKQVNNDQRGIWTESATTDSQGRFYCDNSVVGIAASYSVTGSYLPIVFLTSATERMRIDSSGRVTMPYQPAFMACGTAATITTSSGSPMQFSSLLTTLVSSNRSAGYNTSTYRFTAPVAGLYAFQFIYFANLTTSYAQIAPYKNGAIISTTDQLLVTNTNGTNAQMSSGSFILELAVNDYVDIRPRSGYSLSWFGGHSIFSGYLIG